MEEYVAMKPPPAKPGPFSEEIPAFTASGQETILQALGSLLTQCQHPFRQDQLLQAIVETVSKQLDGNLAEIWEDGGKDGEFCRRAVWSEPRLPLQGQDCLVSREYASKLKSLSGAYQGSPLPELPPEFSGGQHPSVLVAEPIQLGGTTAGLLTLYGARAPDGLTLGWLRVFAGVAGLGFDRSRRSRENQRAMADLQSAVRASEMLHSTLDLGELLAVILELATSEVGADRGSVFLVDQKAKQLWTIVALGLERQEIRLPFGRGVAGHVAATGQTLLIPDAYQSPLFDPSFDERFGYRTRNILCVPIRNNRGEMLGVLQLINKLEGEFLRPDIDILSILSVHMALALENAQRHRELLARQRIDKELALARGIQRGLLPAAPPSLPGFDIAVLSEPCLEVGGDYYDFLPLGSNTLLVVADVEGKGMSSAMIMSNLQASLRSLVRNLHSLETIVTVLNDTIREDTKAQKFLSLFLGLIEPRGRSLHYINAGHVPPLLVRASGEASSLEIGGLLVGLFASSDYSRGKVQLLPGDVLLLCTDGIMEANNPALEEYGSERLVGAVRKNQHRPAQELVEFIGNDVEQFCQGHPPNDDRVLMVIKVRETQGV